jgi:3-oxoacyl-[acyl-carrier protein] reductase
MSNVLKGKIALVTGGARGIGRAISISLAKYGATVAVNYHHSKENADQLMEEIKALGGNAFAYQADISNSYHISQMMEKIKLNYGGLDILVNNAGVMTDHLLVDMSIEEWDFVLNVNLRGTFLCTKAAIPFLQDSSGGRIINISSQAALAGSVKHTHYATAKAGILGFTYSLAKELGQYGITVNAVSPGRIRTDMIQERMNGREEEWLSKTPLKRFGEPEEVADAVVFLASDHASYITGTNLHVNGGILMG